MAHSKLTDGFVRTAPPPAGEARSYAIYYDIEVKGFGLRVTKAGARSFVLNYRAGGVERRLTIGSYPDWRAAVAREEAKRLKRLVDQGRDPMGERHEQRVAPTVSDLVDRYLAEQAPRKRERTRRDDDGLIRQWIIPELGRRKVAELRHTDIDKLHRAVTAHGTPVRANRVIALLKRLLNLSVQWEMRADNPARGIAFNPEQKRTRYLSGDEVRRLVEALTAHPNQDAANAVRLLLLTGARRSEVLSATWDQFDFDAGVWVKPSSHTKQKREHRVPLSAPARQLLADVRMSAERRAATAQQKLSRFVFPARTGGHMVETKSTWQAICRAAGLSNARLHDLRHTYASMLASHGLSLPVIGALLGHTQPNTTARYAHLFDDPLRAATERVGAIVTSVTAPAAEPLPITRRR